MFSELQQSMGVKMRQLCQQASIPYGSMLRWRRRERLGLPLLGAPGPKKPGALPLENLHTELARLKPGRRRTRGSGALYRQYRDAISRRALGGMLAQQRRAHQKQRRRQLLRVQWKQPNLAWAIDATELTRDACGRKLYLIVGRDLSSRYLLRPLVALDLDGTLVANHLRVLFERHGPPLILKRDNGSIFNNQPVDELLAAACVIPLNSPAYYPPYNGGIENGIGEFKGSLADSLPATTEQWQPLQIAPLAQAHAHLLNSRPRRCLHGLSAAQSYHQTPAASFSRRERHATFQWIKERSAATLRTMKRVNYRVARATWRGAVQDWLLRHDLITLSRNQQVLPH